MKRTGLAVAMLALGMIGIGGYSYFLNDASTGNRAAMGTGDGTSLETNASSALSLESENVPGSSVKEGDIGSSKDEQKRRQLETQTATVRGEINELIHQFDEQRMDRQARKELEQQMDAKMAQYNQTALSVALDAMQDREKK